MAWEDSNASPGALTSRSGFSPREPSSTGREWLKLAKDAYTQSTTYFENNLQKSIEDGLRLFDSQHPRGSKYNSEAYKYRSHLFRPKIRSVIRKHEAAAWQALFSSPDFANVDPVDGENEEQLASAGINKQLLQYRLDKSLPWAILSIGALQDAMKVGICASFNYWMYQADEVGKEDGPVSQRASQVREDRPCVDLLPVENLRFHPAAKWYDVVGTSPYIIVELPMFLRDILTRMEKGYGKGEPEWKTLSKETILQARITESSSIKQAREGAREDPQTQTSPVNEFDMVMVHLNFIKVDEKCFVYYTLKDKELLSDPLPLEECFLHGEVPITIGFCVLETHKTSPSGLAHLGQPLQAESNEIVNQRLDNVKYVLNQRSLVRRGSNVDVEGMLRNVPGGITMVNDIEKDIKRLDTPDVTSSAFQEQDRVSADMDGLLGGGLDASSVMTNRKLNETVGGMRMLQQGGNSLTEYTIQIWIQTWYLPTLRQLIKLEQHYESDEVILAIASKKAGMYQKFLQSPDLDKLLKAELTITVNAGMGATDPQQRFQSFMQASGAYAQIVQASQAIGDMNLPEVRKELFGLAGWKDSARFFGQVDPRWQQAQQMVQQAQGMAREIVDKAKDRLLRREMQLERRTTDLDMRELSLDQASDQIENDFKLATTKLQQELQLKFSDHVFQQNIEKDKAKQSMSLDWMKSQQKLAVEAFEAKLQAQIQTRLAMAKERQINRTSGGSSDSRESS